MQDLEKEVEKVKELQDKMIKSMEELLVKDTELLSKDPHEKDY